MSETLLINDILAVTRTTEKSGNPWYAITDRLTGFNISQSAEQWEGLRAAFGAEHPGIELRISNMSGELTRADSDQLHHAARYSGLMDAAGAGGWQELLPGVAWPDDTPLPARLKIELRPVTLGGGADVAAVGDGQDAEGGPVGGPAVADVDGSAEGLLM
jgi:hypothetical protein